MVDFVCVLSLLALLLVGFVDQHLDAFPPARLILAGLSYRVQLTHLILATQRTKEHGFYTSVLQQTFFMSRIRCHDLGHFT